MADSRRDSPAERYVRERTADVPGIGRPLTERARLAQRSVESYLTGANNPPRWMERVREIDQALRRERRLLEAERRVLRRRGGTTGTGSRARGGPSLASADARAHTASSTS